MCACLSSTARHVGVVHAEVIDPDLIICCILAFHRAHLHLRVQGLAMWCQRMPVSKWTHSWSLKWVCWLQVGGTPAVLKQLLDDGFIDGSCITCTGALAPVPAGQWLHACKVDSDAMLKAVPRRQDAGREH